MIFHNSLLREMLWIDNGWGLVCKGTYIYACADKSRNIWGRGKVQKSHIIEDPTDILLCYSTRQRIRKDSYSRCKIYTLTFLYSFSILDSPTLFKCFCSYHNVVFALTLQNQNIFLSFFRFIHTHMNKYLFA